MSVSYVINFLRRNVKLLAYNFLTVFVSVLLAGLILSGNSAVIGWPNSVLSMQVWTPLAVCAGTLWGLISLAGFWHVELHGADHSISKAWIFGEFVIVSSSIVIIVIAFSIPAIWYFWGTEISKTEGGIWILSMPYVAGVFIIATRFMMYIFIIMNLYILSWNYASSFSIDRRQYIATKHFEKSISKLAKGKKVSSKVKSLEKIES